MQTKLYVGNLSYNATDADLKTLFAKFGTVQTAEIVMDRYSGRSKGFAFVEMATGEEAQKALELNGTEFLGRNINVSEAKPKKAAGDDSRRGGGGFRDGGRRDRDGNW